MKHNTVKVAALAFAAFATTAAIAACSDSTGPATPASVTPQSATAITATAGSVVEAPTVVVTDGGGSPAAGVTVSFTVTAGAGAVTNTAATTNASGVASAGAWVIGSGVNTVVAAVAGLPPVSFTATGTAGPPGQLIRISGDNQVATVIRETLPLPLTVRVLDAVGTPIAGAAVTFTVLTGGGTIAGASATTDAGGNASSGLWTLGFTPGNQTVSATSGSAATTFTARAVDPCDDREAIAVGGTATGTLETGDCVLATRLADRFSLATTSGQAVNLTLSSGAFPVRLHVHDAAATTEIATNAGGGSSASIKLIGAATTKTITATTSETDGSGAYTLEAASTSASAEDCELVFIERGATTDQTLSNTDCATDPPWRDDLFRIFLPAGASIQVVHSSTFNVWTEIHGPTPAAGQALVAGGCSLSHTTNFTAATAGYYHISATSCSSGSRGAYTLSVSAP